MCWVVAQKTGASAYNLADFLRFGSYETAWSWLHKLRRAMVRANRANRELISGTAEVDEIFIGGKEKGEGTQGRGAETKSLFVVATECIGKQIGRVRFKIISEASADELRLFINETIEPGSTIITEGWSGYIFYQNPKTTSRKLRLSLVAENMHMSYCLMCIWLILL